MHSGQAPAPSMTSEQQSVSALPSERARRRAWPLGVLLLAVLLGFGLAWAVGAPVSRLLEDLTGETVLKEQVENLALTLVQRSVDTADMVPVTHTGVNPYGVNTFFEQEVEEWKLRRSMEMLRDAGIRWVRQQVPWERLEPDRKGQFTGAYDGPWSQFDRIVSLAEEYELKLVLRPDLPPAWARSNPQVPSSAPIRIEDYGDFVEALGRRYRGRVQYYQVWNEPNLVGEWGGPPDAARYVALLREASTRLKAVAPDIVVLSAPLSPTVGTPDGLNQSDLTYLQEMYDAGAEAYFDILSAQGYGLWTGPGNRRTAADQTSMSRVRLLREIMVRNGDQQKSVWIAEYGWNALPLDFPGPATHGRFTEEQQARYTVEGLRRIQREWPWVGVVFTWHLRRVSDEDRNLVIYYYRLLDADFTPRPVYTALQELTKQAPVVERGWFQEDHWAVQYDGPWRAAVSRAAGQGRYQMPQSDDAAATFTFRGTALSLGMVQRPQGGSFHVTVDDRPVQILEAGASEQRTAVISVAEGLSDGPHSVRVEASGTPGEWGLDGVIVDREPQSAWLLPGAALVLLLLLIGAWLLLFRLRTRLPWKANPK